jgi:dynein heavy chain
MFIYYNYQFNIFFTPLKDVQQVAMQIKNEIEDFKPNIPLIQALRNPGMRNRHWEMLTEELKLPVRPKKDLTFKKCLDMGFDKHIDKIAKVGEIAGKEYTIEQALDKMENEWKPIKFEVLPYKATGTYIIKTSDEVSQLLDDHIVMTQGMSFSPFKKAFEERISSWENKLKITQVKFKMNIIFKQCIYFFQKGCFGRMANVSTILALSRANIFI